MGIEGSKEGMAELQRQTGLDKVQLKDLVKTFNKHAKGGKLDREAFRRVLADLKAHGLQDIANDPFSDKLYDAADTDGDGSVDQKELISAMGLCVNGTNAEKMQLMFNLFDENGDGKLTKEEVERTFEHVYRSCFRKLMQTKPEIKKKVRRCLLILSAFNDTVSKKRCAKVSKTLTTTCLTKEIWTT